jgi:signal transduction histidine kinase
MGLSLLADMSKGAGAALTIRSAPGEGTTVRLEMPS